MWRANQSAVPVDAFACVFVDGACLALYVVVVDERRAYLLVAVHAELVAESLCGVDASLFSCHHLQFVVHKQVDIFVHALLVDNGFRVVLVVQYSNSERGTSFPFIVMIVGSAVCADAVVAATSSATNNDFTFIFSFGVCLLGLSPHISCIFKLA